MYQNKTLSQYETEMGVLKVSKCVATRYGFTSRGRGSIRAEVSYSVYFVPANADLDLVEYYSSTRKVDALKAYRKQLREYEKLHSLVKTAIDSKQDEPIRDNVVYIDFRLKRRIA